MKKMLLSLSVIVMTALTLSGTAHSTDLTVNFTANLRETTCDMKLVGGICEELTVLNFGQVLAQGETSKVLKDPAVITAYLGE